MDNTKNMKTQDYVSSSEELNRNRDKVHVVAVVYKCTICKIAFKNNLLYRYHFKNVHVSKLRGSCSKVYLYNELVKNLHHKVRQHKCILCGKHVLVEHVRSHTNQLQYMCKKCNKQLRSNVALYCHRRRHKGSCNKNNLNTNTGNVSCKYCKKMFTYKSNLDRHLEIHEGISVGSCNEDIKREIESNLEYPLEKHVSSCNEGLNKVNKRIEEETNTGNVKRYPCKMCGKTLKSYSSYYEHVKYVHNNVKEFQCKICRRRFSRRRVLDEHIRKHTNEFPFKCEVCYKKFRSKGCLYRHGMRHDELYRHFCNVCDFNSYTKSGLERHLVEHVGEKSFPCEYCKKRFTYKSNLDRHMEKHKGSFVISEVIGSYDEHLQSESNLDRLETNEQLELIEVVDSFNEVENEFNLDIQMEMNEQQLEITEIDNKSIEYLNNTVEIKEEEFTTGNLKLYLCKICGRILKSRSSYNEHVKYVHNKVMEYQCVICKRKFSRKRILDDHMRKHTNDFPFSCETCGQKFRSKPGLCHHRKRYHHYKSNLVRHSTGLLKLSGNVVGLGNKQIETLKVTGELSEGNVGRRRNQSTYFCHECGKLFKTSSAYYEHMKCVHKKIKEYQCSICGVRFSRERVLVNHMRRHTNEYPFTCDICGHKCRSNGVLSHHRLSHNKQPKHNCIVCDFKTFSKPNLKVHMSEHQGEIYFSCSHCKKRFAYKSTLVRHLRNTHGFVTDDISSSCVIGLKKEESVVELENKEIKISCNICGKAFKKKGALNEHVKYVHDNVREFQCTICERRFSRQRVLDEHMRRHTNEFPFECDICEKKFRSKLGLSRHKLGYKNTRKNVHKHFCTECNFKSCALTTMQSHMAVHTGEKNFPCEHCDKSFTYKASLVRHLKNHVQPSESANIVTFNEDAIEMDLDIGNSEETITTSTEPIEYKDIICNRAPIKYRNTYFCHECGKTFKTSSSYNEHVKFVHDKVREFQCTVCGRRFSRQRVLDEHIRIHTNEFPFECDKCDQKFRSKGGLYRHNLLHNNMYKYFCGDCDFKSITKTSMTRHMLVHTKEKTFCCSECKKMFGSKHLLDRHLKIHSNGYFCEICSKGFKRVQSFKRHMSNHEKLSDDNNESGDKVELNLQV